MSENDLPIKANSEEIQIIHYKFDWTVDFVQNSINGSMVINLTSHMCCCNDSVQRTKEFEVVLDCCDIAIESVEELVEDHSTNGSSDNNINYCVDQWSLSISKPNIYCPCKFPKTIKVLYRTKFPNRSLRWCVDHDNK